MNLFTRSICNTCQHVNSCVVTSNKHFIRSCSEYMHVHDQTQADNGNLKPKTQRHKRNRKAEEVLF
ncbi:hypothetical protein SAMN05421766_102316 [Zobellia uliginosa]|uniref:Uncharacterized protein n=1 Tax=Zobellia uliginosa TaxID=143224 RepID=A0ABY1KPN5_9FLAO|nr:hypothetical protein SAMN05421766_102316 [Zobellia uliginosa]